MKSLSQLKRDAKAGKLTARLVEMFGETGENIPERLRGERKIIDSNSVGITFQNLDGKKSRLDIEASSLIEYTDTHIIVYEAGERDLTSEEQAILDKWETMRDHKQEEIDLLTDGSSQYWRGKAFFVNAGYEYLFAGEKRGKRYNSNTKKVIDNKIKGNVIFKYELC